MRRREFITFVGGAVAWPLGALAQAERPNFLRVGTASPTPRRASTSFLLAFEQRMAELGYIDGKNFELEFIQLAEPNEFSEAFKQLARRKVDVLVAFGAEASLKSAIAASDTVPIVMVAIDYDPLRLGYVSNLARPTGNVTGLFFEQIELAAKRIQILKDAFPTMKAATVFWDQISADQWKATRESAEKFGLQVAGIELRERPYDYERALQQAPETHRGFLIVMTSPYFAIDRKRLVDFTTHKHIGSMFVFREYVDAGGLMSYGPNRIVLSRRMADYVNRIARGAKPSDLPIESPTIFETVISLKTARSLGLQFSQAMLLRADEVIE
jgi:putative ABC transport system substrate-binding protein